MFQILQEYFRDWELHTAGAAHTASVVKLIGFILLFGHWVCCGYMGISYAIGFGASPWTPEEDILADDFWSQFNVGLFWAAKILSGFGGAMGAPSVDDDG